MENPAKPLVAIFNNDREVIKMIGQLLYTNGFNILVKKIDHEEIDKITINNLLKKYKPNIVIFDIPPPYLKNWDFLLEIKNSEINKEFSFIITTTDVNKAKIKEISEKEDLTIINIPCRIDVFLESAYKIIDARKGKEGNPQNEKNRHSKELE